MRLRRSEKVRQTLLKARGIKVYRRENDFFNVNLENEQHYRDEMVREYHQYPRSYLAIETGGTYTFWVNSNLWYTFNYIVGEK